MSDKTGDQRFEESILFPRFKRNKSVTNQQVDETLSTQSFYGTAPVVLDQPGPSRLASTNTPSTCAPPDISKLFTLPNSTEKFREWNKVEPVINNFCRGFQYFEMHKNFLKLWVSSSSEILDMATQKSPINLEFTALVNTFCDQMKARFPSNIPQTKPSLDSSHPSMIDREQQNQRQHQALYQPSVPYQVANPIDGSMTFQQQNTIPALYQSQVMLNKASVPHQELNLMKGSDTSQTLREQQNQRQHQALYKPSVPYQVANPLDGSMTFQQQNTIPALYQSQVMLNKPSVPHQELNLMKGSDTSQSPESDESMLFDLSMTANVSKESLHTTEPNQDLNDTIALRNLVRKNVPKSRSIMYETILEEDEPNEGNEENPQSKKTVNRKPLTRENKENVSNKRDNSKRSKTTKKKSEATKVQVKPKPKRKQKRNSEDTTVLKRRKI